MTFFEYLSIAFSLVLALAVSRGLNGVRSAFMAERRYWPHAIWLFNKLLNAASYWWSLWRYSEADSFWNLFTFLLAIIFPVILYLQMDSLVTHHPREITDWRRHYYSEHKWFFGLNTIQALLATYFLLNIGIPTPAHLFGILWTSMTVVLSVVCYRSEEHKTHFVVAVIVGSGQLLFLISNIQVQNLS